MASDMTSGFISNNRLPQTIIKIIKTVIKNVNDIEQGLQNHYFKIKKKEVQRIKKVRSNKGFIYRHK